MALARRQSSIIFSFLPDERVRISFVMAVANWSLQSVLLLKSTMSMTLRFSLAVTGDLNISKMWLRADHSQFWQVRFN